MDSHPKALASEENMILTNLEEPRFIAVESNAHITVTLTCLDSTHQQCLEEEEVL